MNSLISSLTKTCLNKHIFKIKYIGFIKSVIKLLLKSLLIEPINIEIIMNDKRINSIVLIFICLINLKMKNESKRKTGNRIKYTAKSLNPKAVPIIPIGKLIKLMNKVNFK